MAQADQHFSAPAASVERVLALADERMALMPGVAAWKWENKAAIVDLERERIVVTRAVELAGTLGLAPDGVQPLFDVQVLAARAVQAHLHEHWRASGFDFPPPIPSLDRDIRPKLDRITPDMLRAVYLAAPELQRPDFASAYAGAARTALKAEGWTDDVRHELLAALGSIRRKAIAPGASAETLKRIAATGVLRIGMTGDYEPFGVERDGVLAGADVDLAEALAARLKVTAVFIKTSWPALLGDLQEDRFDLALGGISVTPARQQVAAFSVPYSTGGKTIIARCPDTRRYKNLASVDRRGVRVVVNPGGTNEQFVRANIHRAKVVVFPDNRAIFDEIRAGRADVMITDDVEVELQTRRHADLCRALPGTLTHADKAVLMPRDPELVDAVNAWLTEAVQTGEPARLLERHLAP